MIKKYWPYSQKWKLIQILLLKWPSRWYQDFEVEKHKNIFIWNSVWSRMSDLLKEWILEKMNIPNPNARWENACKRAKYRLKDEYVEFYKDYYWIKDKLFFNLF
jgi:hypothetical protein